MQYDPLRDSPPSSVDPTALVIFAFNRPAAFARLVESLCSCPEFFTLPTYIFLDGPRSTHDASFVEETAKLAERLDHPRKIIIKRQENLGLKSSLRAGINHVLEQHNAVIVLEDDLIVGQYALDFFLLALERYSDEKRVVSVCGYALVDVEPTDQDRNRARFFPMTHPWGWATWRDRWQAHAESWRASPEKAQTSAQSYRRSMNVFGLRSYTNMLSATEMGLLSSWWIYWQHDAIKHHQVSLFPSSAQVINGDVNGTGTHASRWNYLRGMLPKRLLADCKATLPEGISIDFAVLDQMVASREARMYRIIGHLGFIRRRFFQKRK